MSQERGDGMRMAELTRVSGVPTATIKFYLREGLLQPGTRTAPNQAVYGEEHLRRLRLVRALREVGGMRIDTIRKVLASVDGAENPWEVVGRVCDAIGESGREQSAPSTEAVRAQQDIDDFLARRGFVVRPESSARLQLAEALLAVRAAWGETIPADAFAWYSEAMEPLARQEVDFSQALGHGAHVRGSGLERATPEAPLNLAALLEAIVYGTVLFEPVLLAMRRLWHERYSLESGLVGRERPSGSPRSASQQRSLDP